MVTPHATLVDGRQGWGLSAGPQQPSNTEAWLCETDCGGWNEARPPEQTMSRPRRFTTGGNR